MRRSIPLFILVIGLMLAACGGTGPATETAEPDGQPATGEAGPRIVTGEVTYTNPFFVEGVAQPVVILEDQGGFVVRDRNFVIPVESQVIGQITSDFFTSPFTYSLTLPAEPRGTLRDVNHDDTEDKGVMTFAVAYWTNTWGDPYLELRDQGGGGWSSAYASTKVTDDRDFYLEVTGGKYLIYAPDGEQQFPSDFGDDKKLFTDDDPLIDVPAGWSVVDLDQSPFSVDRAEQPVIDLYEPESTALSDYSAMGYAEAFDALLEKFRNEYAFTELKEIDWDDKKAEFRPRFEEAEANNDSTAYALALRDFVWSIPDGHVGMGLGPLNEMFQSETAGGIGFAMRETDDGPTIANFVLEGGPAAEAGMVWGAEIISLNGQPIADAISAARPWSLPFSNDSNLRLQQMRYATRFPMDKGTVEVTFKNPNSGEQTVSLEVVAERDSFNFSSFNSGAVATALPVEYKMLPSGYGYIQINSFFDNDVLSIQVWERALTFFNENEVPGIIIDMRRNGGGSGWLADQMAAYFFDEEIEVGNTAYFDDSTGDFYMDPGDEQVMYPPREDLRYHGLVALLVGPACSSACEFFSYNMTVQDRSIVVGQYPTGGLGGSVEQWLMPEDLAGQLTIGRAVDAEGNIHIEGTGVEPTVLVPVTVEALKAQADGQDVILAAAEKALSEPRGAGVTPSAPPTLSKDFDLAEALGANQSILEDLANETYGDEDYLDPATHVYTIPLQQSRDIIWLYAWCTATQEQFTDNWAKITIAFRMNGEDVPLDQFKVEDIRGQSGPCRAYYAKVSNFSAGENVLETIVTFTAAMNDGSYDYNPGVRTNEYHVYIAK